MIISSSNIAVLYFITSITLSLKVNSIVQVDHKDYCRSKSSWTALHSDHTCTMKSVTSNPSKMGNNKSADSSKKTEISQKSEKTAKERLKEYGYEFKDVDGMTMMISADDNNRGFEFDFYNGDRHLNQQRYEEIGEIITELVYERLEHDLNLKKVTIPVNTRENDAKGFFFMSSDALDAEKLLILIHGSGVVRAGQWARSLIINESWESGTMEPYIKQAQEQGFGVVITNGNHNFVVGRGVIKGSDNPQDHFVYVWKHFIKDAKAKDIAVVAHSFGGVVVQHLVRNMPESIERIKAVAFTDSVHYLGRNERKKIIQWFRKTTRNWVSSARPLDEFMTSRRDSSDCEVVSAGTTEHVWTSHMAKDSVFKFINEKLQGNVHDDSKEETSTTKEKYPTATPEIETKRSKLEDDCEKSKSDRAKDTSDTSKKEDLEKGDNENETKNLKDESTMKDDDSMDGLSVENDRKEDSDVKKDTKNGQETASSPSTDLDKGEVGNEKKENEEMRKEVKRKEEEGNGGKGNEETGNKGNGNEETGIEETGNGEKGNEETGNGGKENEGKGNGGKGNGGKGNEEAGNGGKGNEETGNEGKGNEETGNEGNGNEGNGNEAEGNKAKEITSKREEIEETKNDVPVTPV